jgi:SAM-dependent methyltransferase
MNRLDMFTQAFWDDRYSGRTHVWSGRPNPHLITEVSELAPGRAIDVGCGEGGDAIWLAQQGWTVTGVDISPVGLSRAAARAVEAGVEGAVAWLQADLFAPGAPRLGTFDLVTSQYLHLAPEVRELGLDRLASWVAPGGSLLVVSHHPSDLEIPGLRPNVPELFYTASELASGLERDRWEIVAEAEPQRTVDGPEGRPVTVRDAVLHARRR